MKQRIINMYLGGKTKKTIARELKVADQFVRDVIATHMNKKKIDVVGFQEKCQQLAEAKPKIGA
jgi:transposase-like protein